MTTHTNADNDLEWGPRSMDNPIPTTSIESRSEGNPFQKSTKLLRSPTLQAPQERSNKGGPQSQSDLPLVDLTEESTPKSKETHFLNLGREIKVLVEMLEENGGKRRTIHQPMRDAIESIRSLYELSAIQLRDEAAKEVIRRENSAQTTPGLEKVQTKPKRKLVSPGDVSDTPDPKRKQKPVLKKTWAETVAVQTPTGKKEKKDGWTKVSDKKGKKEMKKQEPRKSKPKPDAILIEKKGDKSYVELLTSVKNDPKLTEVAKAVSKIRRTQKGDLLIQLSESGTKTAEFQQRLSEALGQQAVVKTLTHRVSLEIRDMDEATSKEEISAAIRAQFNVEEVPVSKISLRKGYGGTQTASFSLPAEDAKKLLEMGKIKIGWISSHIREVTAVSKCFKCLEFGHIAKQCKSEEDRSKLCRKCGTEGHIAKNCNNAPLCMFCRSDPTKDAKHIAGSGKCPVFKQALNKRK